MVHKLFVGCGWDSIDPWKRELSLVTICIRLIAAGIALEELYKLKKKVTKGQHGTKKIGSNFEDGKFICILKRTGGFILIATSFYQDGVYLQRDLAKNLNNFNCCGW